MSTNTWAKRKKSENKNQEACVSGEKVTLAEVEGNAVLKANLKKFMNGVSYEEGKIYVRTLTGERKDPASCRGFFDTSIDLVKCEKFKAAGVSRMQVRAGVFEYLADGRYKDKPAIIPLTKLCSDGNGMSFDFIYDQKFSIVKVGPWLYSIRVVKDGERVFTNIQAMVMKTGDLVSMNKLPIEVGPVQIEPIAPAANPK